MNQTSAPSSEPLDENVSAEMVDADNMTLHLSDGTIIPIVQMFDEDGDPTDDLEEAVVYVAGTDLRGWIAFDVSETDLIPMTIH